MKSILNSIISALILLFTFCNASCHSEKSICIHKVEYQKNDAVGTDIVQYELLVDSGITKRLGEITAVRYYYGSLAEDDIFPNVTFMPGDRLILLNSTSLLRPPPPIPNEEMKEMVNAENIFEKSKIQLFFSKGDSLMVRLCHQ